LYLSGTFSASATWNGISIGSKGSPGGSAGDETPGPIDAVLHIPAAVLQAGRNTLLLEMSSHHVSAPVTSVIHGTPALYGLRVAPFSAHERRPIGYYAVPFFMLGVLLVALVAVGTSVARTAAIRTLSLLIVGSLIVAAIAEVSRSVINYPYSFHELRMTVLLVATTCAGVAIAAYAINVAAWSRRYGAFWAVVVAIVVAALLPISWGPITVRILATTVTLGLLATLSGVVAGRSGSGELIAALAVLAAFAIFDNDLFMDRGLYAGCIPLVAHLAWHTRLPARRMVERTYPVDGTRQNDRFVVRSAGTQRIIPLEQVRAIHGAGNYSELELSSGRRILDDRSLTALSEALPLPFFRVHRSHIVNLRHITKLRALGSGKYTVVFADQASVPVSRARVADLREVVATQLAASGAPESASQKH
jgi:hypothetical protein